MDPLVDLPCLKQPPTKSDWIAPPHGGGGGGAQDPAPPSAMGKQMHHTTGWGPQWVRFASPQLAPTAPATTVFIALSSVRQIMFSVSVCPGVQWLGSGARTRPSFSTAPGQLSLVGLWECKHSARLTPMCLVDRHFLHWARGVHAGQGSSAGRHLLPLAPLGHAFPLLVFGPWAYRPSGCRRRS